MTDKGRKRELKRQAKARMAEQAETNWEESMLLEPEQLRALLDYLDRALAEEGCDHTLRLTGRWAAQKEIDTEALAGSLAEFGGGCDCEVLANVDPLTGLERWPAYERLFER
jgi:hypothetical protein